MQDKIYNDWKRSHSELKPPRGFSRTVMKEIHELEALKVKTLWGFSGAEVMIPTHRFARWAVMIGLGALGVFRISYIAVNILVP